jgi:hypothetical protein
MVGKKN